MSNKYIIKDNNWIWLDDNAYKDFNDKDTLLARGKYLTEVIDKIPNKLNLHDADGYFEYKGSHRKAICLGPSSGKTTMIRQFVVDNYFGLSGVFATKLVKDTEEFYYDVIAQCLYKGGRGDVFNKVVLFNDINNYDKHKLQNSNWVICTHERLFVEPSSLLYVRDYGYGIPFDDLNDAKRNMLIIDEYPSVLSKSVSIKDLATIAQLDTVARVEDVKESTRFSRSVARKNMISDMYNDPDLHRNIPYISTLLNNAPVPTNNDHKIYDLDKKSGLDSPRSQFNQVRITYYSNVFLEKLRDYINERSDEEGKAIGGNENDRLYYTLNDIELKNIYILDGTADILFKNSKIWELVENHQYDRKLNLVDDKVNLLKTKVSRNDDSNTISNEYAYFINNIIKDNPGERVLIYLWKNSKSEFDTESDKSLNESIISKLTNPELVDFIHYQSGKERVTSRYANDNIVVILGKFFIPNSAVDLQSKITESNLSTKSYTLSLIIQFIYRSSARRNKPIKLFITDDYDNEFINDLMRYLNHSEYELINSYESNIIDVPNSEIIKTLTNLTEGYVEKTDKYIIIDSKLAYKLFISSTGSVRNDHTIRFLNNNSIHYEYIKGTKGRYGTPSTYKIYLE